jgi:hypothetical protein
MQFDLMMPLLLFLLPLMAVVLAKRAEGKIKAALEEKSFGNKDSTLFMIMIFVAISVILFIPDQTILVLFMFSYASLLFTFSYTYSNMRPKRLLLYCGTFAVASVLAAVPAFSGILSPNIRNYGFAAFVALAACTVATLLYSLWKADAKRKWYVAALAPVMFLLLFLFYSQTSLWFPYLLDVFGLLFATLIIIYLAPMFNWKIIFIYAVAITIMDIILVWGPGNLMVQAADTLTSMNLPVLVWFPNIPPIFSSEGYLWLHGLGLGDLFFTGVLSFQTLKKLGTKTTLVASFAIAISFGINELMLMNPELTKLLPLLRFQPHCPFLWGGFQLLA